MNLLDCRSISDFEKELDAAETLEQVKTLHDEYVTTIKLIYDAYEELKRQRKDISEKIEAMERENPMLCGYHGGLASSFERRAGMIALR